MTVTDIIEISKTKVKVCIDNDIYFALYKSELGKLAIKKDSELSCQVYDEIMNTVLLKRAKLRCMNLLKSRDYTKYQLKIKLRQGVYPEKIIDAAVAYVESYGYVDDVRYAEAYIGYAGQSKSRRCIENDLLRKGVSKKDIEQAYINCDEDSLAGEDDIIKKLLEKKHFDKRTATSEECQKMIGFLYRKGFETDKIYEAVGQYNA